MAYLGNNLQVAFPSYRNIDDISGSFDGIETSFALTVNGVAPVPAPINSQQCLISVNGVVQRPDDSGTEGFRLSGGNIIFASAPAGGVDFFGIILAGSDYVNVGADFPSGSAVAPSITFDSDLDTGIYNPAGNEIGFTTGGTQRLVINSSGQISSNLGTAAAPAFSFISDPNTGIYSPGADQLALSTSGVGRVFVDASGQVGIGETSPNVALHISSANDAAIRLQNTDAGNNGVIQFSGTLSGTAEGQVLYNFASNYMRFYVNRSERMRIDSSGRLLVGTSSARTNYYYSTVARTPGVQYEDSGSDTSLSVYRSDGLAALYLANGSGSIANGAGIGGINFVGNDGTNLRSFAKIEAQCDGTIGTADVPGRLVFSTTADGASTPTERMRISSDGGISTNGLTAAPSASSFGTYLGRLSAGRFETFYNTTSGGTVAQIGGTQGYAIVRGDGDLENTNNRYTGISDIKLKQNIEDASSQWQDIKSIQVRKYELIEHPERKHIGVVAQELEQVCPGLVIERVLDEETGETVKSVAYSVLYMKAVKALQEAMERIETLEAEVAALKGA